MAHVSDRDQATNVASDPPKAPESALPEAVSPPGSLPLDEVDARTASQHDHFRHDNTICPLAPAPGEPVTVYAVSGSGVPLARAAVFYEVVVQSNGSEPSVSVWPDSANLHIVEMAIDRVDWEVRAGYTTRWKAVLPGQPDGVTVRYRIGGWLPDSAVGGYIPEIWANDGQGFWFRYPGSEGRRTFTYTCRDAATPDWLSQAVVYHIFLDRFHPGTPDAVFPGDPGPTGRHGGTFRGVTQALPYLSSLGVTCLWLSPHCRAETYHRYDTTDLYNVDPDLGSDDDLRALIDGAHGCGMRVLLDLVPSHCSWHHPAFLAAQRDRHADTASWFTFERWPDVYRNFLGHVPALPSFDTDNPGARSHIIGSAVHWLRNFGADGFRLDHAIGPGMDFWSELGAAVRAAHPLAVTIGEVTDTPECVRRYRGRLDGVLDFLLAGALGLTFAGGEWGVAALDGFLTAHDRFMAAGPARVSFLDNHDMPRFLYRAGGDKRRLKCAALCQFTLAPVPTIYYGTEIGLSQQRDFQRGGDSEARHDMPWDPREWDDDLLTFYRGLIGLRAARPALRGGERRTVHLDNAAGTYAYVCGRHDAQAGPVLAAFNLGARERTISLPRGLIAEEATCLIATSSSVRLDGAIADTAVALAPMSAALFG